MPTPSDHPIYNQAYYQTSNYHHYDGLAYRAYHFIRYLWLGVVYRLAFGVTSILDVGCATGMSVWVFRRLLKLDAYGIDVSPYAVTNGVTSIQPYLACVDLTTDSITLPRQQFDLVVSYDAFEHLPDDALPEILDKIFALTHKAIFGIYVLDEPIAMWHNWFNKPHADHLSEHTSAWWMDRFSALGYVATHLPLARRGALLVRRRPTL